MALTEVTPAERLAGAFAAGRSQNRALLMPFFVCGYPDPQTFVEMARAAASAGADVLEIGIPFSDPIMDGPVIQAASNEVLGRGMHTDEMLRLAGDAATAAGIPAVVMTYYNLLFRAGLEHFARATAAAGLTGAVVPDLPVEESGPWRAACADAGLAPVFMAAQTSTEERLRAIGSAGRGFVYAASLLGVTGVRDSLNESARDLVSRIRAATDLPVAVGIGVSTPEHARAAAQYADGVIVGSAIVSRISGASDPVAAVREFVAELRGAVAR